MSPRIREAVALVLLAGLFAGAVALAMRAGFRAAPSVDSRTYIEMTRGFADHGLPYLDNGPSDVVPEMRARWNVHRGGHLWGIYPPLFPFVASFAFKVGGMKLVSRANMIVSLWLIGLGVFALARRLTRDTLAAVGAAYATLFGTLLGCLVMGIDSFGLVTALATWTGYFALRATDEGKARWAVAAGVAGAAATASHLLALPVLAGAVGALALVRCEAEAPLSASVAARLPSVAGWLPSRASIARAGAAVLAAGLTLAPVALLNRVRFGSPSPATYGGCAWKACFEEHLADMTLGKSIAYAIPVAVWGAGLVVVAFSLRRSRWRTHATVLAGATLIAAWPALRSHGLGLLASTLGYLVDNAAYAMAPLWKPPDGLGNFLGPFAVKSMLQGSPFLALAFVGAWVLPDRPQRVVAVMLPPVALLALLALRGNLPLVHALGFPFLNLRYVAPAVPALTVVAVAVARHVRLGAVGWVALLATGVAACLYLYGGDDLPLPRRLLLLRVTLLVGLGAAVLAVLTRRRPRVGRSAAMLSGIAFALGVAASSVVDDVAVWRLKVAQEDLLVRVERQVPARFALVGWPNQIDPVLSLRASRDVEYIDLYESHDWGNFRMMIDRWEASGRPVFTVFPVNTPVHSPWPDVWWEPVDLEVALFRVRTGPRGP
jgi:hypothetical protein